MKTPALTFLILISAGAFAFAQDNDWYRAHEWDFNFWGTYALPGNTGDHTANFANFSDDDVIPRGGPVIITGFDLHTVSSNDRFIDRDNAWGGGADVKYFFCKYFGVGLEGFVLDCNVNIGGAGLGTFTFRYPFGRFAPYIWGGFGDAAGGGHHEETYGFVDEGLPGAATSPKQVGRFFVDENTNFQNTHSEATGQVGTGLEFRITKHVGIMGDFAWNALSGPNNNFGMTRFGVTLSY